MVTDRLRSLYVLQGDYSDDKTISNDHTALITASIAFMSMSQVSRCMTDNVKAQHTLLFPFIHPAFQSRLRNNSSLYKPVAYVLCISEKTVYQSLIRFWAFHLHYNKHIPAHTSACWLVTYGWHLKYEQNKTWMFYFTF